MTLEVLQPIGADCVQIRFRLRSSDSQANSRAVALGQ